jgi:hypothetical protein
MRVADAQATVTNTQSMVADAKVTVTNTQSMVADTQMAVVNTQSMVADMHRSMQKGSSDQNCSVGGSRHPQATQCLPSPRHKPGQQH